MKFAVAGLLLIVGSVGYCAGPAGRISQPRLVQSQSVVDSADLFSVPTGGLERTDSTASPVTVTGAAFAKALKVKVGKGASETNATQLCLPNRLAIRKGDVLLATVALRGKSAVGGKPAQIEVLFEKATSPWTKSITQPAFSARTAEAWRTTKVAFVAAENYQPGEAMLSLRFATQAQSFEVGGISLINFQSGKTVEELSASNPLGPVKLEVFPNQRRQTFVGLGGNFCQARYGRTETLDNVGRYTLANLKVASARVGVPLDYWSPNKGEYADRDQAAASFRVLLEMKRRGIPTVATIWEGPTWLLTGQRETTRTLAPERYAECIEVIKQYLLTAKRKYGVSPDFISFNEPDYGINFKFSSAEMGNFIRQAAPEFYRAGVPIKFLVGDTANGTALYNYAKPLLEDPTLAPYLGPISFHCWDSLSASEESYTNIAKLGIRHGKAIWCLEAGFDAQLWQTPNAWGTWNNALRTAQAYSRTARLTGSSLISYWTYQDNYPIVDEKTSKPYPIFQTIKEMQNVFRSGSQLIKVKSDNDDIEVSATRAPNGGIALLLVNPGGPGAIEIKGVPAGYRWQLHGQGEGRSFSKEEATGKKGSSQVLFGIPSRSVLVVTFAPRS